VRRQIKHAADILAKHYQGEDHVFIFDNSPTHTKRGAGAPSAVRMPKFTSKTEKTNFLVETMDEDGVKVKVPMTGGCFSNGDPQSFYWPEGHQQAGLFKGMAEILKERGWENAYKIRADCRGKGKTHTDCCLRHILFNEPDFANPTSILERLVRSYGYGFLLLPKFHPELNPIEQCWGKAKRVYREYPESVGIRQLEQNVEAALNSVSLEDIRK
jgi:transposase